MNRRKLRRLIFGLCIVASLVVMTISWLVAGSLVAPAHHFVGPPPTGSALESLVIRSDSGSNLAAWYFQHQEAKATVILLHPNRTDRRAMLGRSTLLHEAGYGK